MILSDERIAELARKAALAGLGATGTEREATGCEAIRSAIRETALSCIAIAHQFDSVENGVSGKIIAAIRKAAA